MARQRQQEILEREPDLFRRDLRRTEGGPEERRVTLTSAS
jgi:hypothetical protein